MTAFLDLPSDAQALSAHLKEPVASIKAPTSEGEIPKVNRVKPVVVANGTSINGVQNGHISTASDPFKLASEYAYTPRKLKVFTIGAGFSGLLMAHKFQHRFPGMQDIVDHTIFEAHHEVGGTW